MQIVRKMEFIKWPIFQFAVFLWLFSGPLPCFPHSLAHANSAETDSALEAYPLMGRLEREFAKLELKLRVPLIDFEVLEGVNLGFRYYLESYPSGVSNKHTRIDRYQFNIDVNPGDWIEELSSPIGFGIRRGTELLFARQFASQQEALLQAPYHIPQIPLNAKIARERLNPGDFVAFKANLRFLLSLSTDVVLYKQLMARGATHALIQGEFLVHIFRMEDNRLRIKFFALRGRQAGAKAGIGLGPDFEILGVRIVDRRIRRLFELSVFEIERLANTSDLFLTDYVFDLNSPDAAQAYDDLMFKKLLLKEVTLTNPWQNRKKLGDQLLTDLTEVDNLYREDLDLPLEERRIIRLFQGVNTISARKGSHRFGAFLVSYRASLAQATNRLIAFNHGDEFSRFIFQTYERRSRSRLLFNLFGAEDTIRSGLLLTENKQGHVEDFLAFVLGREREFKNLSERTYRWLRQYVESLLPERIYREIDWPTWDFSQGKVINVFFKSELFLNPESFFLGEHYSRFELAEILRETLREFGRPRANPRSESLYQEPSVTDWTEEFEPDIWAIVDYLSVIFSRQSSPQRRYDAYQYLRHYDLFHEVGAHYLIRLIPTEYQDEVLKYNLILVGEGQPDLRFFYGHFSQESIYETLLYVQDIIERREFRLRHYLDEDGGYRLPHSQLLICCDQP